MGKLAIQILFFPFLFAFLLHTFPTTAREVDDEREFNYVKDGKTGPSHWGDIHHAEWTTCSKGSMQSPIDLSNTNAKVVSNSENLKRSYNPCNATLKNRGHDIMLEWEHGAGTIEINGTEYVLRQCHWHSPSEHTIDGKGFNLELHMVHESKDGKHAVFAIMYTIGAPDSFLLSLTDHLRSVAGIQKKEKVVGIIDPKQIKIGSRQYYRYSGSLSIPPCTENVIWTIIKKERTVSKEQVHLLRVAVHDESDTNARPTQQLNGRSVLLYSPQENSNDDL